VHSRAAENRDELPPSHEVFPKSLRTTPCGRRIAHQNRVFRSGCWGQLAEITLPMSTGALPIASGSG